MIGKLAVIDDDAQFLDALTMYLRGRGYNAYGFSSYVDAKRTITQEYTGAIVDLHLIDGDGIDLIGYFRQSFPAIKIIVITGKDTLPKRLKSFGLGADDYMMKPIFPVELEARMKRFFRTNSHDELSESVDAKKYTKTEATVMRLLLNAQGMPINLETFRKAGISNASVYTCLSRLKKKLKGEYEIKTAYGRGYYINALKP